MSYQKLCDRCGNTIFLSIGNDGKWNAYEDSTSSMLHRCSGIRISRTTIDRIAVLERIVRHLIDRSTLQEEEIRELKARGN